MESLKERKTPLKDKETNPKVITKGNEKQIK
jgi:hypothetical protein